MANSRRKRLEREIDRDARVTTSGFVHEIVAATLGQLQRVSLASACPDPVDMFDAVDAITRKFRNLHRRLNDARINRRGEAPARDHDTSGVPVAAQPFLRNGTYLGSYASLQTLAADALALDALAQPELARLDLTGVGLDLHLHGIVWTVMVDGRLQAFRPPPQG